MFETQKSGNKTGSGYIGLNIRTHASPKVGQDQVSGGVSVFCLHAASVANVLWKPCTIRSKVKFGNKVEISNRVKNWCNVWLMEGVTVYGHPQESFFVWLERDEYNIPNFLVFLLHVFKHFVVVYIQCDPYVIVRRLGVCDQYFVNCWIANSNIYAI